MLLTLQRKTKNLSAIIGEMAIDGHFECYTLENPLLVIPAGHYSVSIYDSPDHGFKVPLLHDVPGRTYIEIHPGNWAFDSKGCILVGTGHDSVSLSHSRIAFDHLFNQLQTAPSPIYMDVCDLP